MYAVIIATCGPRPLLIPSLAVMHATFSGIVSSRLVYVHPYPALLRRLIECNRRRYSIPKSFFATDAGARPFLMPAGLEAKLVGQPETTVSSVLSPIFHALCLLPLCEIR